MLLKRIKYHNFRPFIGDQSIDLTRPADARDKNVVVILGDNTFGKSTFVLSFIWCLYGESRFSKHKDILNTKVFQNMPAGHGTVETAYVEVEFEDDNKQYTMRRTQKFAKDAHGQIKAYDAEATLTYISGTGETIGAGKSQHEINRIIKSILPIDLSSFFFFEGEKNNEIKKKDLGTSVRTLLGLEAFDKMRTHLHGPMTSTTASTASVMGSYKQKQSVESDERAQEEADKMAEAEAEYTEAMKRIQEIDDQISVYENLIEQVNEKLRQAGPSKELQARRDQIEQELKTTEAGIEKNSKSLLDMFSKKSLPVFIYPLISRARNRLDQMKINDKGIKGIEATALRELLHRGECLCGCELREGSVAYRNVEKFIDYVPPRSLGTLVRDLNETLDEVPDESLDFVDEFEEKYADISNLRVRRNELESEDQEILAKIKEIGLIDTQRSEQDLITNKRELADLRAEKEEKIQVSTSKKNEMETAERNMNTYLSKSKRAKKYQEYYEYAKAIFEWVNSNYSVKENELRGRLNDYVSASFNNMYSGERDISIDEKYNINLTYKGQNVDDTGGLRVIQYFAYVGGLVKLAYEIMNERREDEENQVSLGEEYPLVLDAAFSHADEKHTKTIAAELSKVASQLVFAIMKKDWLYAKDGLNGKVARMYELEKIDETEVQIREVKI